MTLRARIAKPRQSWWGSLWAMMIVFALVGGCAQKLNRQIASVDHARAAFAAGDLDAAQQTLLQVADQAGRLGPPAQLDLAIIEMANGDVAQAESRLRKMRDHLDAAPEISIAHGAAAAVTDDTARIYRAAGYEEVMVRAMLALCSMAGDQIDAESYSLQAITRQNELKLAAEEKGIPQAGDVFQPVGFSHYLRGVLREATHRDYDDASRHYQLVSTIEPQFDAAQADIARATSGVHSPPGYGALYVIACVGEGPRLQETVAPTTSQALSIASGLIRAAVNSDREDNDSDSITLPNIASVRVPQVLIPPSGVVAVGVRVRHDQGEFSSVTQTITDIGRLASEQNQAEMPWTIARAVARRVLKEAAVARLGNSLGLSGNAGSLFQFAAASAWAGSEKTDTRCWGLLPRELQVLRAELPAGQHTVTMQPIDPFGALVGAVTNTRVTVDNGRNTYLIVMAPREKIVIVNPESDR